MKETFCLALNSAITTNRLGSNKYNYQYNINWSAILPKSENISQKYLVKFSFMCLAQIPLTTEIYQVLIDFGGANMYEQTNSKSTYLGFVYPYVTQGASTTGTNTAYGYYIASASDNMPVCIEYPNNSIITVNLVNLAGGAAFSKDYILTLEFTQI